MRFNRYRSVHRRQKYIWHPFTQLFAALEQGDLDLASELSLRIWLDGPFRQPEQVDPLSAAVRLR